MERVTGIGGLFFQAEDPEALTAWYDAVLGVTPPPLAYGALSWRQEAGPTVIAAMPSDSPHAGTADRGWTVNFRVRDLDAMVEQVRQAGTAVEVDPEVYPNGRFADLRDPEGNAVQLWQPGGVDADTEP